MLLAVLPRLNPWHKGQAQDRGVRFVIEPTLRFRGEPGEQATMFFLDPSRNALEIKAMAKPENLFAR